MREARVLPAAAKRTVFHLLDVQMSLVHVWPAAEQKRHDFMKGGADCYCEPRILDLGWDTEGRPARVFVHQLLDRSMAPTEAITRRVP